MSRCYPYPPPGYQKKAQPPELNVAAKVASKDKQTSKEKEKKGKDPEKEKKGKDPEKEKKGKDPAKEKKGKDPEKEKKGKDPAKEKKGKDPEKEKRGKDSEKEKGKDPEKEKAKRSKDENHKENKEIVRAKDKDKEKHKERRGKDETEKRKKDGEVNGVLRDKDPRGFSKLQRTSQVTNVHRSSEENGRVRDGMPFCAVASPLDRDDKDGAKPSSFVGSTSHSSSMYISREHRPNGKVDPTATFPPSVLSKPLVDSLHVEVPQSSRHSNHSSLIDSNNVGLPRPQKLPDFFIYDTLQQPASWSTSDDENWLHSPSENLHRKPKAKVEEHTSQQVWAEAVYLWSVDMYALPYVTPH